MIQEALPVSVVVSVHHETCIAYEQGLLDPHQARSWTHNRADDILEHQTIISCIVALHSVTAIGCDDACIVRQKQRIFYIVVHPQSSYTRILMRQRIIVCPQLPYTHKLMQQRIKTLKKYFLHHCTYTSCHTHS